MGRMLARDQARLLIVEDSENLCSLMQRGFEQRGYEVRVAHSAASARGMVPEWMPEFVLLDLRLPDQAGLQLIPCIRAANPAVRLVILTGYASIATAVEAIKLGAADYLVKPADVQAIEAAFLRSGADPSLAPAERPLSVGRLAWEHIHQILRQHGGNISASARALGMDRRTLQRKLAKHPAR